MTQSSLSLFHRIQQPKQPSATPPLLILLHGYGSNEADLLGLAPYLDPRLLILSVRAPHPLTLDGYGAPQGYAWFDLHFTPSGITFDATQIEHSRALIAQFIGEAVAGYQADPTRVYLLGFSQGAMMSAAATLTQPELVAGAALMSGWIPPEAALQFAGNDRLVGKPIIAVHGTYDQVLPIALGRAMRATLAALPVALRYREYPMAHEVSAESLRDVAAWLRDELG